MSSGGREAAKAASSEGVEITGQVADGVWARVTEWRRDPARLLFAPDGTLIGKIHLPDTCANLCFGGANKDRLFMAASQSLYAVYVNTQGAQLP